MANDLPSYDTLMGQAVDTVLSLYKELDGKLPGIALKHPEAFANLVHSCALDFAAASIATRLEYLADKTGNGDYGVETALIEIAQAIAKEKERGR